MVPKAVALPRRNSPKGAEAPRAASTAIDKLRSEVSTAAPGHVIPLRGEVTTSTQNHVPPLRGEVGSESLGFEQKWKIEAVVSKEVKAKLDRTQLVIASDAASRCKSLLSRTYPQGVDYEVLLGELTKMFLEHVDPQRKQQRRILREAKQKRSPDTNAGCGAFTGDLPDAVNRLYY
jgi:hypothetical protein